MIPNPDIHPNDIYPQGPIRPDIADVENEVSLGEMLANLWDGRYIILATTVLALALGYYYAWRKSPIYQVEAMLQIEDKQSSSSSPMMEALNSLLDQAAKSAAEIEIIKSNLVLGRTVETLSLDIQAAPAYGRLIGDALVRGRTMPLSWSSNALSCPTFCGVPTSRSSPWKRHLPVGRAQKQILATGKVAMKPRPPTRANPWCCRCAA
ncbi:MAG: hypothetical protein IPP78_00085 [Holophagaceae bacterium]|nr:hypothetical protein [Holophagaceae bacterium]